MTIKLTTMVAFTLCVLLCAQTASGDDKEEAKKHFDTGNSLRDAEDYSAAAVEYETSIRLFSTKNGLFNLANCYKALYRYGEALETFARLHSEFEETLDDEMLAFLRKSESEIRRFSATLEIQVDQPGASVTLNGKAIGTSPIEKSVILGPGKHVVEVSLQGFESLERRVTLISGQTEILTIVLKPAEQPSTQIAAPIESKPTGVLKADDKEPMPKLFWVGLSGTLASGVVTGMLWFIAGSDKAKFRDNKERYLALDRNDPLFSEKADDLWLEMEQSKRNSERYNNIAIGFSIATGVFAAATAAVLVHHMSGSEKSGKIEVRAGPGSVVVRF